MDKPQSERKKALSRKPPNIKRYYIITFSIFYFGFCANTYIITQKGRTVPPPPQQNCFMGVRKVLPTYIIAQGAEYGN